MSYLDFKSKTVWLGLAAVLIGFLQLFGIGGMDLQGGLAPVAALLGTLLGSPAADPVLLIILGGGMITGRRAIGAVSKQVEQDAKTRMRVLESTVMRWDKDGLPSNRT